MKKINIIIAVMMASLIGYASCGVNVVDYCCSACEHHKTDHFTYASCDDVHQKYSCTECDHTDGHCCSGLSCKKHCSHMSSSYEDCKVHHFELNDFTNSDYKSTVQSPLIDELPYQRNILQYTSLSADIQSTQLPYLEHIKPTSRGLLCLHSTLIIWFKYVLQTHIQPQINAVEQLARLHTYIYACSILSIK